jgi:hypothetical protein
MDDQKGSMTAQYGCFGHCKTYAPGARYVIGTTNVAPDAFLSLQTAALQGRSGAIRSFNVAKLPRRA